MTNVFHILTDLFKGGLFFALAILIVLVLRRLLRILIKNALIRKRVSFYLPIIEFVFFFSILIGTSYSLINKDQVVGLVVVLILLLSVSRFLNNYISGIVFRLTNRNITGSIVEVDDTTGRVSAYLMTSIAVKNQQEEVIKIPYVQFYNKYKTASVNKESTVKIVFTFDVEVKEAKSIEDKIKNSLQSSTWVVLSKEIRVDYSISSKQLEVSFYSISNAYESEVKKRIEKLL